MYRHKMQRYKFKISCLIFAAFAMALSACEGHHDHAAPQEDAALTSGQLKTGVVSEQTAKTSVESWGKFLSYYEGRSDHVSDILTGVAVINPGEEIHPPHKHPEEEFLMVIEGSGTWSIKGINSPALAGDILFAVPGELHGLKNTGNTPLKFVVFKYNPKP